MGENGGRGKKGKCKMIRAISCWKALGKMRTVIARDGQRNALRQEGQALVEAALVLPLLLIAGTGILVFGIYIMQIMTLTEGVGSSGRVLAVSAGLTTDPCSTAATAFQNAAPLLKADNLSYTIVLNSGTGNQTYSGSSCSSSSTTSGAAGFLVSGGTATVRVSYSNCSLAFYGNNLLPNGCQISQQVTETVQ
jgi:Flp pilus assembly protein TadG